jgi:hypothetical protein
MSARARWFPLAVLLAAIAVPPAIPAESDLPEGLTERGNWNGSWYLFNRDERIALFVRSENGAPQIRLRYQHRSRPDAFETDWEGSGAYFVSGQPATFELKIAEHSDTLIRGTLSWNFPLLAGSRETRSGEFKLYRTENGRKMLMDFDVMHFDLVRPESGTQSRSSFWRWVFLKASKRVALWEELPF